MDLDSIIGRARAVARRPAPGKPSFVALRKLRQEFTSASTSRSQLPAIFQQIEATIGWRKGTSNLDVGGGRFDLATGYLRDRKVTNLVYDPFNRSDEHNASVLAHVDATPVATVTCANVLNVVKEPEVRAQIIDLCASALEPGGSAFFSVYFDRAQDAPGPTRDGWQERRPLASYLPEILQSFASAIAVGGHIRASL